MVSLSYRKTTLTRLLYRFYDVQEGSITLDGHDLRDIKLESLRKNIGVVPQVLFFFFFYILQHFLLKQTTKTKFDPFEGFGFIQ
jgi:ABC-type transport system involved in Fe-S cluster assembly fused permease/ATPase subunit